MSDLGSPEPTRHGIVAIAIVLAIFFGSFAAWWFVTADADEVDVRTPAAVRPVEDPGS